MERNKGLEALCLKSLWMEHRGFEPLTSTMRTLRATNCANAPYNGWQPFDCQPFVVWVERFELSTS